MGRRRGPVGDLAEVEAVLDAVGVTGDGFFRRPHDPRVQLLPSGPFLDQWRWRRASRALLLEWAGKDAALRAGRGAFRPVAAAK